MKENHRAPRYFLLSYSHMPPLPGQLEGDLDQWVQRFFVELSARVAGLAGPNSGIDPGFCDVDLPLDADGKAEFTAALETAEVFVPLYSPGYFSRSRTGREWTCFHERMLHAGVPDAMSRIIPVLWTPLLGSEERSELARALALGEGRSAYRDLGLQGLSRLRQYEADYDAILGDLAARIVALAEDDPVGPSMAPDLNQVASRFRPDRHSSSFGVAVAAPSADDLPMGAPVAAYGKDPSAWRPYEGQTCPLALYARDQAERLDYSVTVASVGAVPEPLGDRAGVVLIDPWFVAGEEGPERLRALLDGLPAWVLPVVVQDAPEDPRKAPLIAEVLDIVYSAGVVRRGPARAAVDGVTSLKAFVALMPFVVSEAERLYLARDPAPKPPRRTSRQGGTSAADVGGGQDD
ncbi:TIR-like protein FxsC [Spirillospora sp. CA-294931]|uniref:TIR-like protein FxsC n=1 Tax=Spirillospora sp. CA-294931 TaxID=3240042 RepID=UPI003D93D4D3